jgi:RNA polymerase sigma factor for flagellar operon FliA
VHRAAVINYESLAEDGDPEAFLPIEAEGPEDVALEVERRAYLADAVNALPDRLRVVVVAYFFEERTMQDIADELGVSESRISQLRTEALALLKDGMNSQLTPEAVSVPALPKGRAAKRRRAYYDDVERRARSRRPAVFAD